MDIYHLFSDGSYEGTRYFETEPNRGLFCRAAKLQRLVQNGANSGGDTSAPVKTQSTPLTDSSKLSTSQSNLPKGRHIYIYIYKYYDNRFFL